MQSNQQHCRLPEYPGQLQVGNMTTNNSVSATHSISGMTLFRRLWVVFPRFSLITSVTPWGAD